MDVLNAMLGFQPGHKAVFKFNGQELILNGIYDSQDWNPNEKKIAVFEFSKKSNDEAHAE